LDSAIVMFGAIITFTARRPGRPEHSWLRDSLRRQRRRKRAGAGRCRGEAGAAESKKCGQPLASIVIIMPVRSGLEFVAAVDARSSAAAVVEGESADEDADVRARPGVRGPWPASSRASHADWSSRRCCGSSQMASRGEMPKNPASNSSMRSEGNRAEVLILRSLAPRGSVELPGSHRSPEARAWRRRRCRAAQEAPGLSAPPGKRQPIPTIATGFAVSVSSDRSVMSVFPYLLIRPAATQGRG